MSEHLDVLVLGAGLSGIGAAARLTQEHPQRTYAVLESRAASGGTWDLFRYPGVRSDSDMFTLGYRWRPWTGTTALADGPSILDYVRETAREYGVDRHIRYHHRVVAAAWDSDAARWTRHRRDARRPGRADLLVPVVLHRLLRLRRGLPARAARDRGLRRRPSCTRSTGPRTSTTPASGSW